MVCFYGVVDVVDVEGGDEERQKYGNIELRFEKIMYFCRCNFDNGYGIQYGEGFDVQV